MAFASGTVVPPVSAKIVPVTQTITSYDQDFSMICAFDLKDA